MSSVIIIVFKSKKTNSTDLDYCINVNRTNVVPKISGKTLGHLFKVTYWICIFNVLQSVCCGILTACTWKWVYEIWVFKFIFKLFCYYRKESGGLPGAFIQYSEKLKTSVCPGHLKKRESVRFTIELNDLIGIFQPKWFYN